MSEYTLDDQDVVDFLARKLDDSPIGAIRDGEQCFLAQVLREKYPEAQTIEVEDDSFKIDVGDGGDYWDGSVYLSDFQEEIVDAFDSQYWFSGDTHWVSKKEWADYLRLHSPGLLEALGLT